MSEIKASDIMLNNWFSVNGFSMYIDAIYSDMVSLDFKGNEGGSWEEYTKDLIPIPLTEDVLLKFGFEKVGFGFYLYKDFIVRKMRFTDNHWRFIFRHRDIKDFEHIHELQNLVRCLTKTELIVEL